MNLLYKNLRPIVLFFAILLFQIQLSAQSQWVGNTNTTDNLGRLGKVGFGINSPLYPIHVNQQSASTTIGSNVALTLSNYQYTVGTGITLGFEFSNNLIGASITGKSSQSSGGASLSFNTRDNYGVYRESMIISGTGKVGIGVNPTNAKLEIKEITNTEALRVDGAGGAFAFVVKGGGINTTHLRSGLTVGQNYFLTPPLDGMIVQGNVGIGTTDPGIYKLAVEGRIGARSIKVTSASWADFVFDEAYSLMSLSKVEAYIESNKHLPEIPSAEQVKENGFVLEEMDALLLQKIEELTLHLIAQEKKISKLESIIKQNQTNNE